MCGVDLPACSSDELRRLAAEVHAGQRLLDGYLARIAGAARSLESSGRGSTASGVLSSGGDLSPSERERFAALEHDVALRARTLPPETFEKYLADVLRRIADVDDGPSEAERQRAAAAFTMGRGADGMWWLRGRLDDERGAEINALIGRAASDLAGNNQVTANHRAAALYQGFRGPEVDDSQPSTRLGVGYIVDAKTLSDGPHETSVSETWAGEPIDPSSVGRLSCDTDCYAVLVDQLGRPEAVGRTRRRATREQRLQLRTLYSNCPLDGTAFDRCELHHVNQPWEDGGETELDNLLPISIDWHHRIHDRGWTLKMAPDRSLKLWRPDGTLERSIPPPTPITRE